MRHCYDAGGYIPPSLAPVLNSGGPVRVATPAELGAMMAGACGPMPMLERPIAVAWGGRRNGKSHAMEAARMAHDANVPATPTAMRSILEAADAGTLVAPEAHDRYARAAYARALAENLIDGDPALTTHAITERGRRMLAILGGTPRRRPPAT